MLVKNIAIPPINMSRLLEVFIELSRIHKRDSGLDKPGVPDWA
jgi:hypothetical protein